MVTETILSIFQNVMSFYIPSIFSVWFLVLAILSLESEILLSPSKHEDEAT